MAVDKRNKDMKVGKHTLLIDGNYFVFSRLFVLPKPKNGEQLLGDDKQKSQFMRKLAIDFASEMRKLKMFVDDVVLTVDSKSWRKDLYPEADYKGTRKQSSDVDWTAVYGVYEEFQKIVAKKGVTVHQIQGAEADDVIFGWSTMLNARGKSCIVWSGDKDLIQLVNYSDTNDAHTLWYYNTRRTLYAYQGFEQDMATSAAAELSTDDMLFNMGGQTMLRFYTSSGSPGSIKSTQSTTYYNTSSDYRLKENVDYTWDATTRLKQLKPARFNFIADSDTIVDGFLAHEAAEVVPEAVSGVKDAMMDKDVYDKDGNVTGTESVINPQSIDQAKLVPLLVKTIQELEARITALEA